jgi:flagellar basal body-associated protein FliL
MKEQKKKEEVVWDKKKIIMFLVVVFFILIGAYELKLMILGEDLGPKALENSYQQNVRGVSIQEPPQESLRTNVQEQINNLKEDAQNINVVEIASSSPQVQKIINDLKAIQNYPSNQIKEVCEKVCSGL